MAASNDSPFNNHLEPEITPSAAPLGLRDPLQPPKPLGNRGFQLQFLVPLGAHPISILDPTIFLPKGIQDDSGENLFQNSPVFANSGSEKIHRQLQTNEKTDAEKGRRSFDTGNFPHQSLRVNNATQYNATQLQADSATVAPQTEQHQQQIVTTSAASLPLEPPQPTNASLTSLAITLEDGTLTNPLTNQGQQEEQVIQAQLAPQGLPQISPTSPEASQTNLGQAISTNSNQIQRSPTSSEASQLSTPREPASASPPTTADLTSADTLLMPETAETQIDSPARSPQLIDTQTQVTAVEDTLYTPLAESEIVTQAAATKDEILPIPNVSELSAQEISSVEAERFSTQFPPTQEITSVEAERFSTQSPPVQSSSNHPHHFVDRSPHAIPPTPLIREGDREVDSVAMSRQISTEGNTLEDKAAVTELSTARSLSETEVTVQRQITLLCAPSAADTTSTPAAQSQDLASESNINLANQSIPTRADPLPNQVQSEEIAASKEFPPVLQQKTLADSGAIALQQEHPTAISAADRLVQADSSPDLSTTNELIPTDRTINFPQLNSDADFPAVSDAVAPLTQPSQNAEIDRSAVDPTSPAFRVELSSPDDLARSESSPPATTKSAIANTITPLADELGVQAESNQDEIDQVLAEESIQPVESSVTEFLTEVLATQQHMEPEAPNMQAELSRSPTQLNLNSTPTTPQARAAATFTPENPVVEVLMARPSGNSNVPDMQTNERSELTATTSASSAELVGEVATDANTVTESANPLVVQSHLPPPTSALQANALSISANPTTALTAVPPVPEPPIQAQIPTQEGFTVPAIAKNTAAVSPVPPISIKQFLSKAAQLISRAVTSFSRQNASSTTNASLPATTNAPFLQGNVASTSDVGLPTTANAIADDSSQPALAIGMAETETAIDAPIASLEPAGISPVQLQANSEPVLQNSEVLDEPRSSEEAELPVLAANSFVAESARAAPEALTATPISVTPETVQTQQLDRFERNSFVTDTPTAFDNSNPITQERQLITELQPPPIQAVTDSTEEIAQTVDLSISDRASIRPDSIDSASELQLSIEAATEKTLLPANSTQTILSSEEAISPQIDETTKSEVGSQAGEGGSIFRIGKQAEARVSRALELRAEWKSEVGSRKLASLAQTEVQPTVDKQIESAAIDSQPEVQTTVSRQDESDAIALPSEIMPTVAESAIQPSTSDAIAAQRSIDTATPTVLFSSKEVTASTATDDKQPATAPLEISAQATAARAIAPSPANDVGELPAAKSSANPLEQKLSSSEQPEKIAGNVPLENSSLPTSERSQVESVTSLNLVKVDSMQGVVQPSVESQFTTSQVETAPTTSNLQLQADKPGDRAAATTQLDLTGQSGTQLIDPSTPMNLSETILKADTPDRVGEITVQNSIETATPDVETSISSSSNLKEQEVIPTAAESVYQQAQPLASNIVVIQAATAASVEPPPVPTEISDLLAENQPVAQSLEISAQTATSKAIAAQSAIDLGEQEPTQALSIGEPLANQAIASELTPTTADLNLPETKTSISPATKLPDITPSAVELRQQVVQPSVESKFPTLQAETVPTINLQLLGDKLGDTAFSATGQPDRIVAETETQLLDTTSPPDLLEVTPELDIPGLEDNGLEDNLSQHTWEANIPIAANKITAQHSPAVDTPTEEEKRSVQSFPAADTISRKEGITIQRSPVQEPDTQPETLPQLPQVLQNLSILHSLTPGETLGEASAAISPAVSKAATNMPRQRPAAPLRVERNSTVSNISASSISSQRSDFAELVGGQTAPVRRSPKNNSLQNVSVSRLSSPIIQAKRSDRQAIQLVKNQSAEPSVTAEIPSEADELDEMDLEMLARAVYDRLRQRLRIEQERRGRDYSGRLPW